MKPTTLHELSFGFTMAVSVGSRMMNIYEENLETCILCRTGAEKGDRYYIRTDVKSIAGDLLRKIPRYLAHLFDFLPMNSVSTSLVSKVPFCCRTCKKLLEKRQRQADNLAMVENDIRNRRKLGSSVRSLTFAEEINSLGPLACPLESSPMPSTREKPNLICDLSPIAVRPTTCTSLPDNNPLAPETEKLDEPPELGVKVVVTWPSQTKQRKLKKELEPLGKCLLQGTWMDIARAAFRIKDLRTEMLKLFLKEISKECCEIISTKSPSLLRKNSASDMQDLSLQKVCIELKARSPLLYSVMMTAAIPVRNQKHSLGSEKWLPSVAVAGSVLLKQRSRNMNAVQLMVTTLIKYTGFHAMCHFLSSLRIGVSPSYYNKKSDEFGQLFNNLMIQQKQEDEAVLKSCSSSATQSQSSPPTQNEKDANSIRQQEIEQSNQSSPPTSSKKGASGVHQQEVEQSNHSSPPTGTEKDASSVHQQEIRQFNQSSLPTLTEKDASSVHQQEIRQFNQSSPPTLQQEIGPGWKIAFDNLDIFQKVREMTEDNQNKDHHWINHVKVTNRVSGNHLPDDKPICDSVMDLDNYKIIPTVPQHISQRGNYILLIERVITEEIPCLSFCKDVVTMHIPHSHSKEMATKSEKECLGVIFEDENTTEGINRALHQFHSYVPLHSSQGGTVFNRVGVVGDQLSVERAVNCISSLANGFTPEERLDGLHVEIADWHAELKFLALIYQRFYSTVSANDKCTLFADRNSINRRNVKADAHHAYAPNKQMFLLAVKSRIVASAMKILGLKQLDGSPTAYHYPRDESQHDKTMKRVYLRNLASQIVDKFIVDEKSYNLIVNHVLEDHDNERARQAQMTPDGRFPCREIGCNKTFRHDGQHRRNHERSAHGLIIEDPPESEEPLSSNSEESDDMFNYQCDLMDHGLLYMNFIDAVAEGDGDRIIRCWKFLLLHFYSDKGSTKYAIEALYLQLQQQALLSPRQAYRQRWNRGANNHSGSGKNVPLDLEVEHDNNAIKEGIRKLGPNLTRAAVSRCARMLPVARGTVHNVARECNLMKRSGKHFVKTTRNDLIKLVNQLVQENALTETPGRRYKHFKEFPRSPLRNLRMGKLCKWINKHKYELQIGRKAR